MKKKLWAVLVAFVALTVFATSAFAAVRWRNVASIYPGISAGDNSYTCEISCLSGTTKIDCTLVLYEKGLFGTYVELAFKILEKNIPNRVYKYRTSSEFSLTNFRNDTIWATNPANFNDPFDSVSIEKDISLKELDDILRTATEQMTIDDKSNGVYKGIYDTYKSIVSPEEQEKLEALFKIFSQVLTERTQYTFKVACLSETNTSVLMWSHYSNDHKGFCIEYNGQEIYNSDLIKKRFFPVKYISENERQIPISALALDYPGLYSVLCKTNVWSYEKEWRICFGMEENLEPSNIQLPKSTGVYIGAKMPSEHRKAIIDIAKTKNIPIYQEMLHFSSRSISFERIM